MKCNHVRSHATVGCHAHNQKAVGDGEMMEVPWILEQEDWEQEPHQTPHRGITLPVWMIHKNRWRGDKRRVQRWKWELRKRPRYGTRLMQLNKTGQSALLLGFRHTIASSKQINVTSEKRRSKQWFPISWQFTAGCVRSSHSFPLMVKPPSPHSLRQTKLEPMTMFHQVG